MPNYSATQRKALCAKFSEQAQQAKYPAPVKLPKYRNKPVTADGQSYRSRKELFRHRGLLLLELAGQISELQREVPFKLLPAKRRPDGYLERAVTYYADFCYKGADGLLVVEDVKSVATKTKDYILKRKMMMFFHGIAIQEV